MGAKTVPFPVPMTLLKRVIGELPKAGRVEAGSHANLVEMATIFQEMLLRCYL